MRLNRKLKNIIAASVLWGAITTAQPAHAFVWPVINFGQIITFVHSLATGISELSTANAQIQNYAATIHSIGDQISAAAKYVADLQRSIAKIEANVNRITININRSKKDMNSIMGEVQKTVKKSDDENADIANSTEENVSQSVGDGDASQGGERNE